MDHDHEHMQHMDHSSEGGVIEYVKFFAILTSIFVISLLISRSGYLPFMEALMGIFLVTFAGFKLINLKEFAYGFQSYDLLAKQSLAYSFAYPFIQLTIGVAYLLGFASLALHLIAFIVAIIASVGVLNSLLSKQQVHCVCLGSIVKLPLSRISFVEDFGMAIMALLMMVL